LDTLLQNLRYGIRSLQKNPGFTLVAVLTLALGIGANTAIFTLVNATMLRPLPYPDPARLVHVSLTATAGGMKDLAGAEVVPWSYPKFQKYLEINRSLEDVAGYAADRVNLTGSGEPHRLRLAYASSAYFHLLGVPVRIGHSFSPADDAAGSAPVALLAESLWRGAFGADPRVLGRSVTLNRIPVTIIGVVSSDFSDLAGNTEMWVPLSAAPRLMYASALSEADNHWCDVVGRRRAGVSLSQASQEITGDGTLIAHAFPVPAEYNDGSQWGASVSTLADARRDGLLRRSLLILFAAVACILVIACFNIAGLFLARNAARQREIAVRKSFGASRRQLLRPLLCESILIAFAGAGSGLVGAIAVLKLLAAAGPDKLLRWGIASTELIGPRSLTPDARVLAVTILATIGATVIFGLLPALRAIDMAPATVLKGSGSEAGGRSPWRRMRLVVVQTALATALVIAAGLLARSLTALTSIDLGFSPARILAVELQPPDGAYSATSAPAMHARLIERSAGIPGVLSAAVDNSTPLTENFNRTRVKRVDDHPVTPSSAPAVEVHLVSPDYFRLFKIPLRMGRPFELADRRGSPRVAIVNEAAARRLWPGVSALGHRLALGMGDFSGTETAEIVGLARDSRFRKPGEPGDPAVFLPDSQSGWPMTTLFIQVRDRNPASYASALRSAVRSVDPDLPFDNIRTMREHVDDATSGALFATFLLALFAFLALALSAIGIYGVCAEAISARTREFGIRQAVGASPAAIRSFVRAHAIRAAAAGGGLGIGAAFLLTRLMRALLFDVTPTDPISFLAAPLLLAVACLAACERPARRAARVNPMVALRSE
jgi:putative ABC transport system permease protein